MTELSEQNPFRVNRLGGVAGPFPLAFEYVRHSEQCFSTYAQAQTVSTLLSLLEPELQRRLCVFDVGHYEVGSNGNLLPLEQLALKYGVAFERIDSETLVLAGNALQCLLDNVCHYDLQLFQVPSEWTTSEIENYLLSLGDRTSSGRLGDLGTSELLVDSHDDCYLCVEQRTPSTVAAQLAVLLGQFASALSGTNVPSPSITVCRGLLERSHVFQSTQQLCELMSDAIGLGLSTQAIADYDVGSLQKDIVVHFDRASRAWTIS